jgi:uncharacterized protein YgiM (DUF1202 family)
MKTRFVKLITLVFLLLTASCQPKPEKKAEQVAREQMIGVMGADAVDRSVIEVHPSKVGWMVIFRDANASCEEGFSLRGACRFGDRVFRDVYACVERNWSIRHMGASGESESLGEEDLCQVPTAELPTAEPISAPYVIVDTPMYVRNGPSMEFNVIGEIESQKKYLVLGKYVDWWLVDLGDHQSGWVYALAAETRFFGNANAVPTMASPPMPTSEVIPACTPANKTETSSEGLEKARNALSTFFELLNHHEYEEAVALYGGDYQGLRDWNPLLDPQDYVALLTNGCEINGLQCLRVKRIVDEKIVSLAEYEFTVEFMNQDGSLFVRGPCCGGNATDFPPESQFAYTVIRNCAGEFLVRELPAYVP